VITPFLRQFPYLCATGIDPHIIVVVCARRQFEPPILPDHSLICGDNSWSGQSRAKKRGSGLTLVFPRRIFNLSFQVEDLSEVSQKSHLARANQKFLPDLEDAPAQLSPFRDGRAIPFRITRLAQSSSSR
jgi:hypothetical protein